MSAKKLSVTLLVLALSTVFYTNCSNEGFGAAKNGSSSSSSSSSSVTGVTSTAADVNVMPVTVGCGYPNEPCVSVTICVPGTSTCQTIANVLLDTGSYGLRLFATKVSLGLSAENASGGQYAECVSYADGSSDWGPVKVADVMMGQERASSVPIQMIDASYGTAPSDCTDLDSDPTSTGFNGILGVGLMTEDCGTACVTDTQNREYFVCSGSTCTASAVALAAQVTNPVSRLTSDNNGVILQMQSIADSGAVSAAGYLIMGIGTRANNTPSGVNVFSANENCEFDTTFAGKTYTQSFIDSGSMGIYFPVGSGVAACSSTGNYAGWYCPATRLTLSATQTSASGATSLSVPFHVGIASTELAATNPDYAFNDLSAEFTGGFDWGFSFFYGKSVFVGIDGRNSSLGTGPYWAF